MDSAALEDASSSQNAKSSDQAAEKAALRLIARAEQSSAGILRKLCERGHPQSAVRAAIAQLTEAGMIDDDRYARLWAASRILRKAESPRSLVLRLRQKGIEQKTAKKAVHSAIESFGEIELLRRYLASAGAKLPSSSIKSSLRNEGFSAAALEEFFD